MEKRSFSLAAVAQGLQAADLSRSDRLGNSNFNIKINNTASTVSSNNFKSSQMGLDKTSSNALSHLLSDSVRNTSSFEGSDRKQTSVMTLEASDEGFSLCDLADAFQAEISKKIATTSSLISSVSTPLNVSVVPEAGSVACSINNNTRCFTESILLNGVVSRVPGNKLNCLENGNDLMIDLSCLIRSKDATNTKTKINGLNDAPKISGQSNVKVVDEIVSMEESYDFAMPDAAQPVLFSTENRTCDPNEIQIQLGRPSAFGAALCRNLDPKDVSMDAGLKKNSCEYFKLFETNVISFDDRAANFAVTDATDRGMVAYIISPFDFSTPSPDDIVLNSQKQAAFRK